MVPPAQGAPYILAIAGSPRRHGNSEQLLDAFILGATTAGAEVRKLVAGELDVWPCRGCNACSSTGECILHDGMREVYPLIDGAAAIVVASPVFFATVPAVLKLVFDRMQPYWARRYVLKEPALHHRPGAILLARSGGDPYGFTAADLAVRSVFAVLAVNVGETVFVQDVDSPSDLGRHPDEVEEARAAGGRVAAELRSAHNA